MNHSAIGVVVNDRYELRRYIGEGAKKRVFLAHDRMLDREVAFATIKTDGLDASDSERFEREARAMARLGSHPGIVSIFDIGKHDEVPFMVVEYMAGGSLSDLLASSPDHRLSVERALEVALQVAEALDVAHAHGILHRDLTPANIWFTQSAMAKIGDFGLALALDQQRITQEWAALGTVAYMSPEQARGESASTASDLYSLGAVLYEMLCGRPPFVGDGSASILAQQIYVPPMSIDWLREQVPGELNALILQLLEKDAAKRPVSTAAVKEKLRMILAGLNQSDDTSAVRYNAPIPAAGRPFVGRAQELQLVSRAFDSALAGYGSLIMVVGEPGIGKTALCDQVARMATSRGAVRLVGHCYEDGSLSLPYLPFVQAIRTYVMARDRDTLERGLGSDAPQVARLVTEVRDRLNVELEPPGEPENDRWRLLNAVTSFFQNASRIQPIVLILEDLHDADRGTLELLLHLSRNLEHSRILIVGTYRDVDVHPSHALSGMLDELRKASGFTRIALHGLKSEEVGALIETLPGERMLHADTIHQQTAGNPLYVLEVARHLKEEDESSLNRMPEGLRELIGKRFGRLSSNCNQALEVAAVMGTEFDLAPLEAVVRLPEDELFAALEEGERAGILQDETNRGVIRYRFAHAFFRQAIYEGLSAPRRLRHHQRVATALEAANQRRLEEHAVEIAQHFAQSTDPEHLGKAVDYYRMAAERAISVYAFGEAARLIELALDVEDVLDREDRTVAIDLLILLGRQLIPIGQSRRVLDNIAPRAVAMAEALQDRRRTWESCLLACDALTLDGGIIAGIGPLARQWIERMNAAASDEAEERAVTDGWLASYAWAAGDTTESWRLANRSYQSACESNNWRLRNKLAYEILAGRCMPPEDLKVRSEVAEEIEALLRSRNYPEDATLEGMLALAFLAMGERLRAEDHIGRMKESVRRIANARFEPNPLFSDALMKTIDGDFAGAIDAAEAVRELAVTTGRTGLASVIPFQLKHRALIYTGRANEALREAPKLTQPKIFGGLLAAERALCLAHAGETEEAKALLATILKARDPSDVAGGLSANTLCVLLEASIASSDSASATPLVRRLESCGDALIADVSGVWCVGRLIGDGLWLQNQPDQARGAYEKGLRAAERIEFRPEAALCRLGRARVLLAKGDKEGAGRSCEAAAQELDALAMTSYLREAETVASALEPGQAREVYPDRLSEREVEVLRLLALGKSNQELADSLFISLNTVARHVSNIFAKTGVANRTEAASYAHRHLLV